MMNMNQWMSAQVKDRLNTLKIDLVDDERVDPLCMGRWIVQRARGHRATTDDQLLAWVLYRVWRAPHPPRVLELGAGKGTITLILSAQWTEAQFVGIEAYEGSYSLSLKNQKLNEIENRFQPLLGDIRDSALIEKTLEDGGKFDLICGAPPFMPLGSGIMPSDPQRATGRFELRGGLEDYLDTLSSCLKANRESRGVILMDGENHERSLKAIEERSELILLRLIEVSPRPNAPATYEIFELASRESWGLIDRPCPPPLIERLSLRSHTGDQWSDEYTEIRAQLGLGGYQFPKCVVPARLDSSRLHQKALADLEGAPMIARVIDNLLQGIPPQNIIVTSDEEKVLEASRLTNSASDLVIRTLIKTPCHSGSQRVLRAIEALPHQESHLNESPWVINVQGDEPLLPLESLYALIAALPYFEKRGIYIVTLAAPLPEDPHIAYLDRSLVKLCLADLCTPSKVTASRSELESWRRALYFTREATGTHQHIGVYAFHRESLGLIDHQRGRLSALEDLEQLTWLERGAEIGVVCLKQPHPKGVDTPEDLDKMRLIFRERHELNTDTNSIK